VCAALVIAISSSAPGDGGASSGDSGAQRLAPRVAGAVHSERAERRGTNAPRVGSTRVTPARSEQTAGSSVLPTALSPAASETLTSTAQTRITTSKGGDAHDRPEGDVLSQRGTDVTRRSVLHRCHEPVVQQDGGSQGRAPDKSGQRHFPLPPLSRPRHALEGPSGAGAL